MPRSLNVLAITSNAKVESSPPEIPITAFFKPTCSSLFARADDCILKISLHLSSRSWIFDGTKGCLSIYLVNSFILTSLKAKLIYLNWCSKKDEESLKLKFFNLSEFNLNTSTQDEITSFSL